MSISKKEFLKVVHKHDFSTGIFGIAGAPCHICQVPYCYNSGEIMSMGDMYCVLDWQDKAMAADKAGTWPTSFIAEMERVKAEGDKLVKEMRS